MAKKIGLLLFLGGLAALVYSVYRYMQQTDSFGLFGMDVVISQGNMQPVLISVVICFIGLIIYYKNR